MQLSFDGLAALTMIGLAQLAVLAVAFGWSRSLPHRMFAALMLVAAMLMLGSIAMQTELVSIAPHLAYVHAPTNFLLGPLFYFLACAVVRGSLPRRPWLHFLPALLCALSLLPFYVLPAAVKLATLPATRDASVVRMSLLLLQAAAYVAATIALLLASDRQRRLRSLWIGAGAMTLVIPAAALRLVTSMPALAIPALIAVLATATSVYAIRSAPATPKAPKYVRSTLTPDRRDQSVATLVAMFELERPYLDPELSLESLAHRLKIPPGHLSQIVNEHFGRTFRDWLNGWRIDEAKRRLVDPAHAHYSVAGIGEASGYRSKSAFHAAFRRATGVTPTEFRRANGPQSLGGTS
jgi:AraC-like DNA-binding protein